MLTIQGCFKSLLAKPRYGKLASVLALCGIGLAVYSNTFYSVFHFDDLISLVGNPSLADLGNLRAIWDYGPTRFIAYLSFALNHSVNQYRVYGYHAVNICVHLCCTILVWWLALLTFSTPVMKKEKIARYALSFAFFAGLVFVVHPLQTQAVTYIIQRTTSLAALWYLLCLCLYIRSRSPEPGSTRSRLCYFAALVCCMLAMFTKEMAITLPAMLLLYELFFFKDGKSIAWKPAVPFLLTLLVIPLLMVMTRPVSFTGMLKMSETGGHISPYTYLATESRVVCTYLRLFFIPVHQNIDYDYALSGSMFELPVVGGALLLLAVAYAGARLFRNYRLLSFGIFWVLLSLVPESTILPILDVIAEHRLYLPMVGYSFFLVALMYYIFGRKNIAVTALLLAMVINLYALMAYARNLDWRSEISLWDDTVHKSPEKARPHFNRGTAYALNNEHEKAFPDFDKALMIDYAYIGRHQDYSRVYHELFSADHAYARLYSFLGVKFAEIGRVDQAIILFQQASRIDPANTQYLVNLCAAYGDAKRFRDAVSTGEKLIALHPDSAGAQYNLSVAYYFNGQPELAREHLAIATRLGFIPNPEFAAKVIAHRTTGSPGSPVR